MQKFNLHCSYECTDDVRSWISAAIKRNVSKMIVRVYLSRSILLPRNLSMSNTLVELKLDGMFIFTICCLPNLKTLHLVGVIIRSGESERIHFSTCPVLEDLCLERCSSKSIIDISVSSLKRLKLWQNIKTSFVLNLPSLEFLNYFNCASTQEVSGNVMESLNEAHLYWTCIKVADGIHKLIKMAHNLSLHGFPMKPPELPNFQNLTHLKLENTQTAEWKLLLVMLERSPNLQILILHAVWLGYGEVAVRMDHVLPTHEVTCLSMHLKELQITGLCGVYYEFRLVEYFLNNAKVLKKLMIQTNRPLESRYMICLKLLALSRHSKDCQVLVLDT